MVHAHHGDGYCLVNLHQVTLPINLALAWPWRSRVRWVVTLLDEEEATQTIIPFLNVYCRAALEVGLLTVHVGQMESWHSSTGALFPPFAASLMPSLQTQLHSIGIGRAAKQIFP